MARFHPRPSKDANWRTEDWTITGMIGAIRQRLNRRGTIGGMEHIAADEFGTATEREELVAELRQRISRDGPITFREFMAAALYHPRWGYYTCDPAVTSRAGDYVTSPEASPLFGAMIGRQLLELWHSLDRPARFDVIEHGAGRGILARDIIAWARRREPAFAAVLRYAIVEPIARLAATQRETLVSAGLDGAVSWDPPEHVCGVILSNELLDALPVHRVLRQGNDLMEVFVAFDQRGRFVDHLAPPSTPELRAYFDALGLLPGEGCYAEVNLDAPRWIEDAAASLERGYVLTFDYGYEAPDLYAPWRRDGTLLCFYRQSASSDPYQRVGRQDITASVDFTTLRRAGERAGLRTLGLTDQASFLLARGIGDAIAATASTPDDMEEYFARRSAVLRLIDSAGLGRISVLLQGTDVPGADLLGFTGAP